MESMPATIDIKGSMTIVVCRAQSTSALDAILRTATVYFQTWAAHEVQIDRLENGGLDDLCCEYKLRLALAGSSDTIQGWSRPTAQTCRKLGYKMVEGGSNSFLILSSYPKYD